MMRFLVLILLLLVVTGCSGYVVPEQPTTPPRSVPTVALHSTATPNTVWSVDAPRRIDRGMGYVRGPKITLDGFGHAHLIYQNSVEWMDERNDGGVIVIGSTPANDRYEIRLSSGTKGFAANGIGAFGSRIIATAGVDRDGTYRTEIWQSQDGGTTWSEPLIVPFKGAKVYQVDVGFFPDGRAILVGSVRVSEQSVQTQLLIENRPNAWEWSLDTSIPAAPAGAGAGSDHTLWMRSPSDYLKANPDSSVLPAIVVIARRSQGFWVLGSDDGVAWTRHAVTSQTIHYPHITATEHGLILTHTVYGRPGLWLAWSQQGIDTWHVRHLVADGAGFEASTYRIAGAYPMVDAQSQTLFLLIERMGPATERRFVGVGLPLAHLAQGMGTPAWDTGQSWMPIALPVEQTHQTQLALATNESIVGVVWTGRWTPTDFPRTKMVDADYRPSEDLMYTTIRIASFYAAWMQVLDQGAK